MREHYSTSFNTNSASYDDLIHKKIRQYGWDNFDSFILEDNISIEEIDDCEIFWIKILKSHVSEFGYNKTYGGQGQKKSIDRILNKNQLEELKIMLKNGESYYTINKKFKVSFSFISDINNGKIEFDKNLNYPLYEKKLDDNEYLLMVDLLRNSTLTFEEISKITNFGISTVKKVNYGKLKNKLSNEYPIRKISNTKKKANQIKELLIENLLSNKEICNIVNCSPETVRRINLGLTHKEEDLQYPLRSM